MAALFRSSSVMPDSSISPVAILMTWTALLITSAGRLWRIDVFGDSHAAKHSTRVDFQRCRRSEVTPGNVAHEENEDQRD